MPTCNNCNNSFPNIIIKGEKEIDMRSRKYCLDCNPFGCRNFWGGRKVSNDNKRRKLVKTNYICKECGSSYYQKTRNKVCTTCRDKKARHKNRQLAVEQLDGKCIVCSYNKCIEALDFHHLSQYDKKFNLSRGWRKNWKVIQKEIKKCVLLCNRCHVELHAGLISLKPR